MVFVLFTLFLDQNDLFTLISQNRKLNKLERLKEETSEKLSQTRTTLEKLKYPSEVERYAREEKFFKKENEDVFVIFEE